MLLRGRNCFFLFFFFVFLGIFLKDGGEKKGVWKKAKKKKKKSQVQTGSNFLFSNKDKNSGDDFFFLGNFPTLASKNTGLRRRKDQGGRSIFLKKGAWIAREGKGGGVDDQKPPSHRRYGKNRGGEKGGFFFEEILFFC